MCIKLYQTEQCVLMDKLQVYNFDPNMRVYDVPENVYQMACNDDEGVSYMVYFHVNHDNTIGDVWCVCRYDEDYDQFFLTWMEGYSQKYTIENKKERVVLKAYKAYEYNELSQNAKNNVREWIYENEDSYFFNEMLEESINETFPNSELNYQYSLNNRQGDGLSIYGTLSTTDIIEYIENNQQKLELTDKQVKRMKFYCNMLEDWGIACQIHENYYGYAYFNRNDVFFDIYDTFADELENANFKNIHYGNIRRMSSIMTSYIEDFCYDWEKRGYNYFEWAFNASDDEISELCDANEWLFDESGALL